MTTTVLRQATGSRVLIRTNRPSQVKVGKGFVRISTNVSPISATK